MDITPAIVADFRNAFSGQFADTGTWPDDTIGEVLAEADAETGGSGWGAFALDNHNFKRRGMYLFAAHWLTFFYGDGGTADGVGGIARLNTQSKQVGDESISYRVASMMDAGNDALTYTVYGQQFYRLRRRAGMGARVV